MQKVKILQFLPCHHTLDEKEPLGQRKLGFQQLTWGLNEEVTTIKKQQKKLPINILNFLFDNMRRKLCYIYYRIFPILIHQ